MRSIGLAFIVIMIFAGCGEDPPTVPMCDSNLEPAVVYYTGSIALDGCGWLIATNNSWYSPTNLAMEYQIDSLELFLDYGILSDTLTCGFAMTKIVKIQLDEVCVES